MKGFIVLAVACVSLTNAGAVRAQSDSSAHVGGAAPHVLSTSDVHRYRAIFADEQDGQFAAARTLIGELSDRSLMGYVEAEHYLSPRMKHPPVRDLARWLGEYGELPIAPRVLALAEERNAHLRRRHRIALPGLPAVPHRVIGGYYEESDKLADPPLASDAARAAELQIDASVKLNQTAQAESILQQLVATDTAPNSDIARLAHHVASAYLAEGQDDDAFRIAGTITGLDRETAPLLDWDSGFAAYRLKRFTDAAPYFETLAQNGAVPGWTRSAAAFWAARADLAAGNPQPVVGLLSAAAREQPTFYGMLAQRLLGEQPAASFDDPVLDYASFDALMQIPAAHRAVALWQVGRSDGLEQEMSRAFAEMDLNDAAAFAALSHRLDLPDLELRASEAEAKNGELLTGLFPVPGYTPPGGYHIDRCLVLAFARVESRFQPKVVSTAGARGVMQLMPGTAALVDGPERTKAKLNDPAYNLGLGERYLQSLMDQTNGNLFEMAAAYNAGPAALTRWLGERPQMADDPLLFIESIPYAETRSYIKYVMTWYWMYAKRTKTDAPSLEDTAEGKWPLYKTGAMAAISAPKPSPAKPAIATLISDAGAH